MDKVRGLNKKETESFVQFFMNEYGLNEEEASDQVGGSYFGVFEKYITDCPGYSGKVFFGVASGSPGIYGCYGEKDGNIFEFEKE